ncbi:DEAD/DEAH box helicase [bacterium]|nr:DEAD/DEAH box helicase [bacterium]
MKIFLKQEPNYLPKYSSFSYQEEAVKAIQDLEYAAIFHEQGLGKTKIAIDLILYWFEKKEVDTVLIVAKKSLINNWINELGVHTHIKPRVLTQNKKANYYVFNSPAKIMLINYEVMKSENTRMELFLKTRDVAVILDESTKIKNPESDLTQEYLRLSKFFKKRIIMTGTPVANRPYDIWSQIWFLDQGKSLGNDFNNFKKDFDLANTLYKDTDLRENFESQISLIEDKISKFTVRETKASGVLDLPEKIIKIIKTKWEIHQRELYNQIKDEEKAFVIKNGIPTEDDSKIIVKRLLRLVQVASNPKLVDDSYKQSPGKLNSLITILDDIKRNDEKCIIWTSFTANADWLKTKLVEYGTCKVHGKIPIDIRNRTINNFLTDKKYRVLIATPGAAKEGLTLTVANHVIFYDRSFSLDDYLQAQDRIHRYSQKRKCYVYNLIMEDSIDELLEIMLSSKHLAAQLTQGDISLDFYKSKISYKYGEIIKEILGIKEDDYDRG